ncbi:MAG: hypothetical protein V3T72_07555 [Thermoanaerobaculia bacterium]
MPSRNLFAALRSFSAARWVVPLAALLSVWGIAALQSDPAAVAESRFLALLTAGVLAAVAAIAAERPGATAILGWTALLACGAAWIAYHGPSRGAVVTLILVLGLTAAVGRAWSDGRDRERMAFAFPVPAAIGCQLVMRSDLLLPPLLDLRTVVSVLILPALSGGALSVLGARFGPRPALLAGGAVVVLAPGWNVTTTVALIAAAAAAWLADPDLARWQKALAVAVLVGSTWMSPPLGALTVLAGLSLWVRGRMTLLPPAAGLLLVLVSPSGGAWTWSFWNIALDGWLSGLTILPAVILVVLEKNRRALQLAAHGLLFTLLLAKVGSGPEAWAGGLVLIALAIPTHGTAAGLQRAWAAVLVFGTSLLASYPWMRIDPRGDLLELLGLGPPAGAGLLAVSIFIGWLVDRRRRVSAGTWAAATPAALVLLLVAWPLMRTASPTEVPVNSYGAVTLSSETSSWERAVSGQPISNLALDTHLIFGAELARGTAVATVELFDADGLISQSWTLRAGSDTAEWAAARPDVAALPGFTAPPPWISRLAPDGTFFARRFRAHFAVADPRRPGSLMIRRDPALPPDVRLVIYRVELRR